MKINTEWFGEKNTWLNLGSGTTLARYCKTASKLGNAVDNNRIRYYGDRTDYIKKGDIFPEQLSLFGSTNTHYNTLNFFEHKANTEEGKDGLIITSNNIDVANIFPAYASSVCNTNNYVTGASLNKWSAQYSYTGTDSYRKQYFVLDLPFNKIITFPCVLVARLRNSNLNTIESAAVTYNNFIANSDTYNDRNILISNVPLSVLLNNTFTDYDFINNVFLYAKNVNSGISQAETYYHTQMLPFKNDNRLFSNAIRCSNTLASSETYNYTPTLSDVSGFGFSVVKNITSASNVAFIMYSKWGVHWINDSYSCISKWTGTAEELLKDIIGCGFNVADNYTDFRNFVSLDTVVSDGIYTPIVYNDGHIDGSYLKGIFCRTSKLAKVDNDVFEKTGYEGNSKIDTGAKTVTEIKLNDNKLTKNNVFSRSYVFTKQLLNNFSKEIYNPEKLDALKESLKLFGENPMNYIISLKVFPFEIPSTNTLENVVFGSVTLDSQAYRNNNDYVVFDLGSCDFPTDYTFRSYSPYTIAELFIPYVSVVALDSNIYAGKKVSVKMIVDLTVGDCTAVIYANDIPVQYVNGKIGTDISVTGTNASDYLSSIFNKTTDFVNNVTSFTASAVAGNPVSAISSGIGAVSDVANSVFTAPNIQSSGSTSSLINFVLPQNCYIAFHRLHDDTSDNIDYTARMGFACNYYRKLSDIGGLIMCVNPDINIASANNDEKNEIRKYLLDGVFLKWE